MYVRPFIPLRTHRNALLAVRDIRTPLADIISRFPFKLVLPIILDAAALGQHADPEAAAECGEQRARDNEDCHSSSPILWF